MKISRKSLHARYACRTIVEGPALAACSHDMPAGEYQPVASFLVNATENGRACAYSVQLTMQEIRDMLAQLPPPGPQPLKPGPDLDAAIELRMKLDASAKRREAQLRGDGSPN